MSRPYRMLRSMIALTMAGLGTDGLCQSPIANEVSALGPVSYSTDSVNARYSRAGLVRIIEDDATRNQPAAEAAVDGLSGRRLTATSQSDRGAIELAPLGMPNTSVYGIGTGVHPEDVTVDRLPPAQQLPNGDTRIGDWGLQAKLWVPGGFCHQPLYFEDPMLERHGHVRFPHFQPLASGIRFFGTIPALPYLATLHHPLDDVHTLGAYRPGTAAPLLRYRAHYDSSALRNQFIVTAGTAAAVP